MKAHFFSSLIAVLLIILTIPEMSSCIASAAEDTNPDGDGNSTVDLMIESISFDPENPEIGQTVEIIASVKNQGNGTSNSTNLAYYINGSRIGDIEVPEIEAGQSKEISFTWKPDIEGTVNITAKVDEKNSVTETDETNNEKTQSLSIQNTELPDLIIDTFKYTEALQPGENEDIEISVKNQGNSDSKEAKLKLYIDGNSVNEWDIFALSSEESSGPFTYTWIPTSEGSVEIKAVIDEGNLVNESDEENNQKAATITIAQEFLPDLIIEDILLQEGDIQVGKNSNFTVRIKNQGTIYSSEVKARYYINDTASGNISVPPLLQGETKNISFSLTPDNGGKMEVKVVVDSEEALHESNETNNQFIKEIDVKDLRPDLKVESIFLSPESPKLGENINFIVTIKNDGPGDAPANELKYNITGVNENYSGETSVAALSGGNSTKSTFSWTPGNEGQIEIKVMVDADSTVPEIEETNNELEKTAIVSKETDSSSSESSGSSSSSSSGSSGSSSGSAGSSTISKEPSSNVESKEVSTNNIANGYHVKFDFAENAAYITYIEFDPKKTFKRTTTTVEILKNKSIFVSEIPSGKIYKYVNIWVGDKGAGIPAFLENGLVGFKVEKSWIKENNINQSLITLQWYDKGWQLLDTEKVKEDKNYVYFKSKTPGFSCFAITECKVDEKRNLELSGQMETQGTLKNWQGEVVTSVFNESADKDSKNENPMRNAKILVAISLPLFMILVEYFILKKKI